MHACRSTLEDPTADALIAVPGVDLVKTGPWASRISLRGLAGDRVLVLVDGVRVNTLRGHGAQTSLTSPDQLDAVEVQPGASSAEYGSDAMGGVVNLVTHRSLFTDLPTASISLIGRGAEPGGQLSQQTKVRVTAPRFGAEVAGGLGKLDALITPEGRVANSGDRERNLSGRAAARLGELGLDYEHSHGAALDVGLPAFNAGSASGTYPLQSRDADRLELTLPGRGWMPEGNVLGVLQTFRTHFTESTVDTVFRRGRIDAIRFTDAADRVRTRVASVQPTLRFALPGSPRLSFEARTERVEGPRETDVTAYAPGGGVISHQVLEGESVAPARREVTAASLFAGQSWRGVRIESGLRYESYRTHTDASLDSVEHDRSDDRMSGELGGSWTLGPFAPYAHVSSGYRVPNLDELFFDDDIHGGLRLLGNPQLVPERAVTYEGGLRIGETWGGRFLSGRVSAYRSEADELITFRYVGDLYGLPWFRYANLHRARIEGMEYAASARVRDVRLDLNIAFPRGFDSETGERLAEIGAGRATFDVTMPFGRGRQGAVGGRVRWNDAVWTNDPVLARKSFTTLSLEGSYVWAGVRAVAAVRNLLNASYREPLGFIAEPGRTFAFSLRRDFSIPIKLRGEGS